MKKEKGTALLTVILIVFVTVTIGSALASLVMMNYKLRDLDNRIARAEYETEKKIDIIYMLIQETLEKTMKESQEKAETEINNILAQEEEAAYSYLQSAKVKQDGTYDLYTGDYYYVKKGADDKLYVDYDKDKAAEEQEKKYAEFMNVLYNEIKRTVNSEEDTKVIGDNETFGYSSDKTEVKLIDKTGSEVYKRTITAIVFYKSEKSPPIELSVDFIIVIPTHETLNAGNYNLNNLIQLTNWSMQNWGYL